MDGIGLVWMGSASLKKGSCANLVLFLFFFFCISPKVRRTFSRVRRCELKIISRYNFVWVRRVSLAFVRLRRTLIGRAPVNATPSPTPSAADAVTGLSTANTKVRDRRIPADESLLWLNVGRLQPVANAATPAPSCARMSGVRRLSEERLPAPEGCDTLRRYRGDSRTDSGAPLARCLYHGKLTEALVLGKILWRRRGQQSRQSRNCSLKVWHCTAPPPSCNYATMLFVLCEKLHPHPLVLVQDIPSQNVEPSGGCGSFLLFAEFISLGVVLAFVERES